MDPSPESFPDRELPRDEQAGLRPLDLREISTRWSQVRDASRFALRYCDAIQRYLEALLPSQEDAEEVLQAFVARVLQRGFEHADASRGPFRHYLIRSVRNAATSHLRSKARRSPADFDADELADTSPSLEQQWLSHWRSCLLQRAWQALEHQQHNTPGSTHYTTLRLSVEHPTESSQQLAERLAAVAGKPVRADAFRQQLSRARRQFARLLVQEVAETLDHPSPDEIREELREVGLLGYVKNYMPDG